MKKRKYLILLVGLSIFTGGPAGYQASAADMEVLLDKGRKAFYEAVRQESLVDTTQEIFQELSSHAPAYNGLALTYTGAAYTLKGKHAFMPQKKLRYVQDGLQMMEQGLTEAPDDLEALFIYGMTCHHLPFFFGCKEDALKTFRHIIGLLEENYRQYDSELILDVVRFMEEEVPLTAGEEVTLNTIKAEIHSE